MGSGASTLEPKKVITEVFVSLQELSVYKKQRADLIGQADVTAATPSIPTHRDRAELDCSEAVWLKLHGYDATFSLSSNIIEAGKQIVQSIIDTAETSIKSMTGKAYFPQIRSAKSIVEQLIEHILPDVTRSLIPPTGFWTILGDLLTNFNSMKQFVSMKTRFPITKLQNIMYMSYFGRQVATKPFDHLSPMLLTYDMWLLSDVFRLNYTIGRLSRLYEKFTEYSLVRERVKIKDNIVNWKTQPDVVNTSIGEVVYYNYYSTYEFYNEIAARLGMRYDPDAKSKAGGVVFKNYSDQSLGINLIPYERLQSEAVIKIDKFYLFLDELQEYQETYQYGWKTVETLFSNYQYYSGGNKQTVSFKARLYYTNRAYFDYFTRLANSNKSLSFLVNVDSQKRRILITQLDCSYKFQYAKTFSQRPEVAYADFVVRGIILGEPLPTFNLAHYTKDPSLMSVINPADKLDLLRKEEKERKRTREDRERGGKAKPRPSVPGRLEEGDTANA